MSAGYPQQGGKSVPNPSVPVTGVSTCSFSVSTYLLSYLLEAVEDRYTGDAVDLAQRVQADGIEVVLPCYPGVLDDSTGRVVYYHHSLVVLEWGTGECGMRYEIIWNGNGTHLSRAFVRLDQVFVV